MTRYYCDHCNTEVTADRSSFEGSRRIKGFEVKSHLCSKESSDLFIGYTIHYALCVPCFKKALMKWAEQYE